MSFRLWKQVCGKGVFRKNNVSEMARSFTCAIICLALVLITQKSFPNFMSKETSGINRGFVSLPNPQDVPFVPLPIQGLPDGVRVKILSLDASSGACTLLVEMSRNLSRLEKGFYTSDLEIFVLDGELKIGEKVLTSRCYGFIPAGMAYAPVETREGCTALFFFDRSPDFTVSDKSKPKAKVETYIGCKSYYEEGWDVGNVRDDFKSSPPLFLKVLRQDEETGARTWITGVIGGHPRYAWQVHPMWREGFLLEGEYTIAECLQQGKQVVTYQPDGYFFRPANIPHVGPESGPNGYAIWLFRSPNMLQARIYDQDECPNLNK